MEDPALFAEIFSRVTRIPAPDGPGYETIAGTSCMIFDGNAKRYGSIMFEGVRRSTHGAVCGWAAKQEIPEEYLTRHACDRPGCVNPLHVLPGTPWQNYADALERKRNPAFGARNGTHTHPESRQRGVRRYGRNLSRGEIARLKKTVEGVSIEDLEKIYGIAAHFQTTPTLVSSIILGKIHKDISPSKLAPQIPPLTLDELTIPHPDLQRQKLSERKVAEIRWRYFITDDSEKRAVKRELIELYGISSNTLLKIINRQVHPDVAPEIPVILECGSGAADLPESAVKAIRATWKKNPDRHGRGLAAALARLFNVSHPTIDRIVDRVQQAGVADDDSYAVDLSKIPFKELNKKGQDHPGSKLTDDDVREIRRLSRDEGLSKVEIAKRFPVCAGNVSQIVEGKTWTHVK